MQNKVSWQFKCGLSKINKPTEKQKAFKDGVLKTVWQVVRQTKPDGRVKVVAKTSNLSKETEKQGWRVLWKHTKNNLEGT